MYVVQSIISLVFPGVTEAAGKSVKVATAGASTAQRGSVKGLKGDAAGIAGGSSRSQEGGPLLPVSMGETEGIEAPREQTGAGSPSEPGSPTYRALAQHAASIETFLAAGDASTSAQEESTALAQLMQVLNDHGEPSP